MKEHVPVSVSMPASLVGSIKARATQDDRTVSGYLTRLAKRDLARGPRAPLLVVPTPALDGRDVRQLRAIHKTIDRLYPQEQPHE